MMDGNRLTQAEEAACRRLVEAAYAGRCVWAGCEEPAADGLQCEGHLAGRWCKVRDCNGACVPGRPFCSRHAEEFDAVRGAPARWDGWAGVEISARTRGRMIAGMREVVRLAWWFALLLALMAALGLFTGRYVWVPGW